MSFVQLGVMAFAIGVASSPTPIASQPKACFSDSFELIKDDNGTWPYRKYKTTNRTSQEFAIQRSGEALAPGVFFLTLADSGLFGYDGLGEEGAVIMSQDGDLVWSGPGGATSNMLTQSFRGEDVLTVWTGSGSASSGASAGHGFGSVKVFDSHYSDIYTVCPSPEDLSITLPPGVDASCVADVHEQYITDQNTMLVTVYNITNADLTSVGGPADGYIVNSLAVEVEIETNKVLWLWDPQEHIPINSSNLPLQGSGYNTSNPFDWFHTNSIQSFDGGYLINSRQTWSSYFVNRNGDIEWEINGETGGGFGSLPEGYNFSWEHHARLRSYGDNKLLYTNFNDANGVPILTNNPSNGIGLILDVGSKSLQPAYVLTDPAQKLDAFAEGSHNILNNGNHLLGYGIVPFIKEFGPPASGNDSSVRYSAQFAYNNYNNTGSSYRVFKEDWHATPTAPLDVVIAKAASNDTLGHCAQGSTKRGYVSWNGATDVTHYAIHTGSDAKAFVVEKKGFETEFVVPEGAGTVQVVALVDGKDVGKSKKHSC